MPINRMIAISAILDVKPEVHHVAFLNNVLLAFQPPFAGFTRSGFPPSGQIVGIGDHFSANEAALEIAVNHSRRLRRGGADPHRPGPHFLGAGGKVGLQAQ